MKNKVVVFNNGQARILINPSNIKELEKQSNVIVNPDLSNVSGLPAHMWKQVGQAIIPLDINEIPKQNVTQKINKLHLHPYIVLLNTAINIGLLILLVKLTFFQ